MSLDLTADDLLVLENHRLARLCSFFPETLFQCLMHLNPQQQLAIHCAEPWMVDRLLTQIDELRSCGRIVVGAQQIAIFFAEVEVYRTVTQKPSRRSQRLPSA